MAFLPYMTYTITMPKISLTDKKFSALVDEDDVARLSEYRWSFNKGYAQAPTIIKGVMTTIRMHRFILGLTNGDVGIVDHINGDKLDNRKNNLRICDSSQNRMNTRQPSTNKSGYKGVSWRFNTTNKNWVAFIYKDYKQYYLGYFDNPLDAALAYDKAATDLHGEFARINFPRRIAS